MKGYWVICIESYEIDGMEIKKGRMRFHESKRPIVNWRWRRATDKEISLKEYFQGQTYLPPQHWDF